MSGTSRPIIYGTSGPNISLSTYWDIKWSQSTFKDLITIGTHSDAYIEKHFCFLSNSFMK